MKKLQGAITALVTPFQKGKLDEDGLRALIAHQLKGGIDGLVPCGSTGEAATLRSDEYRRVVEITVEEVKGRVPVIAGCSHSATWRTVELAIEMEGLGADALLVAPPPYNKPTQEGVIRHFKEVAWATKLPIVAYNIPGRTAVNLLPATVARITKECPSVIAIKEACGNLDQIMDLRAATDPKFRLLSGDDPMTLSLMALGAVGVVSVVSNLFPREVAKMCAYANKGDFAKARDLHFKLLPVVRTLFLEGNPAGIKTALAISKIVGDELRLPLTGMSDAGKAKIRAALRAFSA